jgi:hypothetical protein
MEIAASGQVNGIERLLQTRICGSLPGIGDKIFKRTRENSILFSNHNNHQPRNYTQKAMGSKKETSSERRKGEKMVGAIKIILHTGGRGHC